MKVILKVDVPKLGKKGEVVEVKDGYGTNFLIHKHKAVAYTERGAEILSIQKAKQAAEEAARVKLAKEQKAEIEKLNLTFSLKENNGKYFGSITTKHIETEIKSHGIDLPKKKLEPRDGLHSLGDHKISIKLHRGVTANLTVHVNSR